MKTNNGCPKTMKRRPCWCPEPILWELNSCLMQTLSFVPISLHRCWPREWKHSIAMKSLDYVLLKCNIFLYIYSLTLVSSLQQFSSFLMFFLRLANTLFQVPVVCSFRGTSGNRIGSHSLFAMFINDLPTNTTSGIKLFADDCVLYCPINSVRDHFAL